MADDPTSSHFEIVPEETDRHLVLPAEMVSKGLQLAIRIEKRQGLVKYSKPLLKFPGVFNGSCINFSRDGQFVAITTYGKQPDNAGLMVWNVAMKGSLSIFPDAGFVGTSPRHFYSVALSRHGNFAFIGYGDGSLYRCDIIEHMMRNYRRYFKMEGTSSLTEVTAIALSPDDQYIATGSGYVVHLRETESGKEVEHWQAHNSYYNQIAFSPDGSKLLLAHGENVNYKGWSSNFLTLLDLSGKQAPVYFGGDRIRNASAVAISPDNRIVVSLNSGGLITVWDALTSEEISHWSHVTSSAAADNDIISKRPAGPNMTIVMKNPMIWGLSDVAISPDGSRLLSGGADHYMRLWTLNGKELGEYPHDSRVVKVAFSPDGRRALAGCWNGSVYLWELP
jgi:WD40 repeat protein